MLNNFSPIRPRGFLVVFYIRVPAHWQFERAVEVPDCGLFCLTGRAPAQQSACGTIFPSLGGKKIRSMVLNREHHPYL
jgi:hypothetical protein